jgi:hypothetical protein
MAIDSDLGGIRKNAAVDLLIEVSQNSSRETEKNKGK